MLHSLDPNALAALTQSGASPRPEAGEAEPADETAFAGHLDDALRDESADPETSPPSAAPLETRHGTTDAEREADAVVDADLPPAVVAEPRIAESDLPEAPPTEAGEAPTEAADEPMQPLSSELRSSSLSTQAAESEAAMRSARNPVGPIGSTRSGGVEGQTQRELSNAEPVAAPENAAPVRALDERMQLQRTERDDPDGEEAATTTDATRSASERRRPEVHREAVDPRVASRETADAPVTEPIAAELRRVAGAPSRSLDAASTQRERQATDVTDSPRSAIASAESPARRTETAVRADLDRASPRVQDHVSDAPGTAALAAREGARPDASTPVDSRPGSAVPAAVVSEPSSPRPGPRESAPDLTRSAERAAATRSESAVSAVRDAREVREETGVGQRVAEAAGLAVAPEAAPPAPVELAPLQGVVDPLALQRNAAAMATRAATPAAGPPQEAIPLHVEWLVAKGGGTARLTLHPPSLGEVELTVRVRGGAVDVQVRAAEPMAQQLVGAQRHALVDALGARDLRMDHFEILPARDDVASDSRGTALERDTAFADRGAQGGADADARQTGAGNAPAEGGPDRAAESDTPPPATRLRNASAVDLRV